MDDEEEDICCEFCYGMHYTGYCLYTCTVPGMLKLLRFQQYLQCRRLAIDNVNEDYMPVGECVPSDMLVGVGPSMLNEKVLAKYYTGLAKLDENKMCVGDGIYWIEFKRCGYNLLEKFERKEFPLPVDLNYEPTIQPEKISIMEDEQKDDEISITNEQSEEEAINGEEINTCSFNFIDCSTIEFVIKPEVEEEVYLVDFEMDRIGKPNHAGEGNVKIYRINEEWSKFKTSKMSKASKTLFRIP